MYPADSTSVAAVITRPMNGAELAAVIDDHYMGEAGTLGAARTASSRATGAR